MTMKFLLLSIVFLFPTFIFAQHCPFDGGYLIAVHLTNEQGKPISTKNLRLVEVNNPSAKSCTYAGGLLQKTLLPTKELLQTKYENYWERWIEPEYKDWTLFAAGFYAVGLNMAEHSCMIKKDNDFTYRKRQFEIHYSDQKIPISADKIFSLCTGNGSWKRIVPIEIKTR